MTVINKREEPMYYTAMNHGQRCSLCDRNLCFPILVYHGEKDIILCASCITSYGQGLMLDIVQAQATLEKQRIAPRPAIYLERRVDRTRDATIPKPEEAAQMAQDILSKVQGDA
jgi:hypothetical protein